jgi:hypothetical protein
MASAEPLIRPTSDAPARTLRVALAVAIVGGPAGFLVGGVLSPAVHADGATTIAANSAAVPAANAAHLVAFVVASFLLPPSMVGLARLAYPRTPWLALIGGGLGLLGTLPFAALAAQDDLAAVMAGTPGGAGFAPLYDSFYTDAVENTYLVVYIIGHLAAYVVLGIALLRARAVPRWAGWLLIASTPLTLAVFALPGRPVVLGEAALALVLLASIPAARAMVHDQPR